MKNGRYAQYRGNEYELTEDMNDDLVIVTENREITDSTFEDIYNTGVYSKKVDFSDLDAIYKITTYALIGGNKLGVRKEDKYGYIIGTNDCKLAETLKLERVDKYGYEGWVSREKIEILEEKIEIQI